MTLKTITLHRAATDNLGLFVDSGAELEVGDQKKAGFINADRAREILDSHGATGHHAKAAADKPKKPKAAPKAKRTPPAPKAPVAPPPPPPPSEPPAPVVEND